MLSGNASAGSTALQIGRLRLRYLLETDDRSGYLCIGVARITEVGADRRVTLDDRWIPPVLVCSAAVPLSEAFQAVVWHSLVSHPVLQVRKTKW